MSLSSIEVVSVPVSNQDRSRDFYVDTLGFSLVADEPMGPDQRWVQLAPPAGGTTITLVTWFPTMPAGSLKGLVIGTDDVEAAFTELNSRGVPAGDQGGIQDAPWGRYFVFDDPDGNGLIVQQTAGS